MSQRLVPISDLSSGGWSPTPVSVQLDEETPSDIDLVESPELPGCQAFSVTLTPAATPPDSLGSHTVSARLKKAGEGCATATVTLLEDGTPIASRNFDLTDEWGTYSFELDAEEAASIFQDSLNWRSFRSRNTVARLAERFSGSTPCGNLCG